MISEFGNYNTRVDLDESLEADDSAKKVSTDPEEPTEDEVTIGSLLFNSPTIYSLLPRRRFRVRPSAVI